LTARRVGRLSSQGLVIRGLDQKNNTTKVKVGKDKNKRVRAHLYDKKKASDASQFLKETLRGSPAKRNASPVKLGTPSVS